MNIFKSKEDFFGKLENEVTNRTLLSLFQLAKQIKNRLGKQSYLLDCYLSIFFDGISNILAYESANKGFMKNNELQTFFSIYLKMTMKIKKNLTLFTKEQRNCLMTSQIKYHIKNNIQRFDL